LKNIENNNSTPEKTSSGFLIPGYKAPKELLEILKGFIYA
jgi:hypothetical protein